MALAAPKITLVRTDRIPAPATLFVTRVPLLEALLIAPEARNSTTGSSTANGNLYNRALLAIRVVNLRACDETQTWFWLSNTVNSSIMDHPWLRE